MAAEIGRDVTVPRAPRRILEPLATLLGGFRDPFVASAIKVGLKIKDLYRLHNAHIVFNYLSYKVGRYKGGIRDF